MSKIVRKTAQIFGSTAPSTDIEQFGAAKVTGSPNYTDDPAVIQALSAWEEGWTPALVSTNNSEYKQDRNAVDYVASYQIAYNLQMGIAEWDPGTTYYTNSIVQYNGQIYISLVDSNLNNTPPSTGSTSYWKLVITFGLAPSPTRTILTSGSGTYTPPDGCVRIYLRMIGGGGGGGAGNSQGSNGADGGNTIFGSYTAYGGGAGGGAGSGSFGGNGGTSTFGSFNLTGGMGAYNIGTTNGGQGGCSIFGGFGQSTYVASGENGAPNSGAGGSGGGSSDSSPGGGGGAGGYGELQILNPSSVSYTVGAGGSGGAGTYTGGNGGSGVIIIDEFYY